MTILKKILAKIIKIGHFLAKLLNLMAQKFWQNTIEEYTTGTCTETIVGNNG